jgi:ferredoxin
MRPKGGNIFMALKITERCINCDMCQPECPNEAISMGYDTYEIDPARCTECVGYYSYSTCQSVCPISNVIILDPMHIESKEQLQAKFLKLKNQK